MQFVFISKLNIFLTKENALNGIKHILKVIYMYKQIKKNNTNAKIKLKKRKKLPKRHV